MTVKDAAKSRGPAPKPSDLKLETFFAPKSIAVVGATERQDAPGGRVVRYLAKHGYGGEVHPITRKQGPVYGYPSARSLTELGTAPELVILAVRMEAVVGLLHEMRSIGTRNGLIFAAGGTDATRDEIRSTLRTESLTVLGPNCTGFVNVPGQVAASFSSSLELPELPGGQTGIVSQSGGVLSALINRMSDHGIGISKAVATGDAFDLKIPDVLRYFATDADTRQVLVYLEGFQGGVDFIRSARDLREAGKRLVVLKGGISSLGQVAASTHTGAIVTDGHLASAVLRESDGIVVRSMSELLNTAKLGSAAGSPTRSERPKGVAFVGTSGGGCVLAVDAAARAGLHIAELTAETEERLVRILPSFATASNPLDVTAGVLESPELLQDAIRVVGEDPGVGVVVLVGLATTRTLAHAMTQAATHMQNAPGAPWVVVAIETGSLVEDIFDEGTKHGVQLFKGLDEAMIALVHQRLGASDRVDRDTSRPTFSDPLIEIPQLPDGPAELGEDESLLLLAQLGVPTSPPLYLDNGEPIPSLESGYYPVALKVAAPSVYHKMESGLVTLNIRGPEELRKALIQMREAAGTIPGSRIFAQSMAAPGLELLLGIKRDETFGAFAVLAVGGRLVEDLGYAEALRTEVAARHPQRLLEALPPLDRSLDATARSALLDAIQRLSVFAERVGSRLLECEINPLIVSASGAVAVDAKIVLG